MLHFLLFLTLFYFLFLPKIWLDPLLFLANHSSPSKHPPMLHISMVSYVFAQYTCWISFFDTVFPWSMKSSFKKNKKRVGPKKIYRNKVFPPKKSSTSLILRLCNALVFLLLLGSTMKKKKRKGEV